MTRLAFVFAAFCSASLSLSAAEQPVELQTELQTPTGVIKGTLTTPAGAVKTLVVLMIAGSGPTDRDGNTPMAAGKNDSLKLLAAALGDSGIASVRYDKRGVAASRGAAIQEPDLRIEDYVQDAASWVITLAADSRFSGVAILGHSEGSLIGLLASQRSPAAAFISVAGPADKASALLRRQLQGRLPPDLSARNEDILKTLETGRAVTDIPAPLLALYRPSVQPYLMSWFQYAPAAEIAKLQIPCLIVQGGTDIQIDVADAERLGAANKACSVKVIAGMNHVMKTVVANRDKQIASYGDPALPVSMDLVRALGFFLSPDSLRAADRTPR